MWNLVQFGNGSNPWISKTDADLLRLVKRYHLIPIDRDNKLCGFVATPRTYPVKTYQECKDAVRDFALFMDSAFALCSMSYSELADWQGFFEMIGRRYGLLTEFRENAIC